jgi:hypothetical protein
VPVGSGLPPSSSFWALLNPVHHIVDSGDYPVWGFPWGLKLGWLSFSAGLAIQPHLVTFLVARRVGQMVIAHFHSVTCQLQMLVDGTVSVMLLILDVCRVVSGGSFLVGGSIEYQVTGQV